jgi:hypothetical protein
MNSRLVLDSATFDSSFPHRPFVMRHSLAGNPLFELPRLIQLSRTLPPENVEYNAGNVQVNQDPSQTPRTGLSVEETIQRIEEAHSWMVLKYVELDGEYRKLLAECLDDVSPLSERITSGMCNMEGFIFVTSPKSITPYHMDPEHNFLLQIRGNKTVHMWDQEDRSILSDQQLESFYVGGIHRNMPFKAEYAAKETKFTIKPGEGLHFPITAPHWVQNEDNVSISFSVTFRSEWSERRARLYQMNADIRKMGINPAPIGRSPWKDSTKDTLFRVVRKTKGILGIKHHHQQQAY